MRSLTISIHSTVKKWMDEVLPHGSGINDNWSFSVTRRNDGKGVPQTWNFHNSFQVMNQYGMYVGWQDFTIKIPGGCATMKEAADKFVLQFNGDRYLADYYGLRDYLEDTIAWALREAK